MDKQIEKQLKEYSKLKGAALREAYAEVVGRDTNETSRERLLNGIARVLIHDAEQTRAKAKAEKKAAAKESKPKKGAKSSTGASRDVTQAPAPGAVVATAGTDTAADAATAPNGADNASDAAVAGATVADTTGTKRRGPSRAAGERDPRLPPAGHVLTREYNGKALRVELLQDNGCLYEGKHYRSLSGLVKELTGTNHNGLLWFGLAKRPAKAKPAAEPTESTAPAEAAVPTETAESAPAAQSNE